jgi:hypothetical protein
MNWTLAIIQAIVIAGISALISYVISTRQKRLDFRYDYRKYILEKRKKAYDEVEIIIARFQIAIPKSHFFPKEFGLDPILEVYSRFINHSSFWVSKEMKDNLTFLVGNLLDYRDIDIAPEAEKAYRNQAWASIFTKLKAVESQYFIDIMRLDDMEAFQNEKDDEFHRYNLSKKNDSLRTHF